MFGYVICSQILSFSLSFYKSKFMFVTCPPWLFLKKLNTKNFYYTITIIIKILLVHSNSFLVVPTTFSLRQSGHTALFFVT